MDGEGPQDGDGDGDGRGEKDAFEGLSLDDSFINAASVHEGSADERVERLRRIDSAHQELKRQREAERHALERSNRKARRRERYAPSSTSSGGGGRGIPWRGIVAVGAVAIGLGWYSLSGRSSSVASSPWPGSQHGDSFNYDGTVTDFPSPSDDQESQPIGVPAPVEVESSEYTFKVTQPGHDDEPVAYDPCQPIHVVVNTRTAPQNATELVQQALKHVSDATGFQFVVEGDTTEVPSESRAPVQKDRYGDRWAPVLIAWSDPAETPGLAGSIAGQAGSLPMRRDSSREVFVTGAAALDGPDIARILTYPDGFATARAVIQHEIGHIVGLGHIDNEHEIMNPQGTYGIVEFGPGDLTGLSKLGQGACFSDI